MLMFGSIEVMSIESGQFIQGDVIFNRFLSSMKMQAAAGSFNMGDGQVVNSPFNINANVQADNDFLDMPLQDF